MYFYVCAAAAYSFPLFRLEVLSLSLSPRGVGPCRVCLPFTAISTLLAAEGGEREETDRGDD